MAAKKGGLNMGKGLQSLIPSGKENKPTVLKEEKVFLKEDASSADKTQTANAEPNENEIIEVRASLIMPNSEQPRKDFDEAAISELAESIKLFGVLQPLLVQKKGKYYEIIAGERRWRAAKKAGLKKIPVIVREYSNQEVVEISLIENIQRQNLNPIEEALAFKRLTEEFSLKQADVAKRVSKSRTAVANSMRLLKLDERVQKMLVDGLLSTGHARALLSLEDGDMQFEAATKIATDALNVRDTEKLIQRMKKPVRIKNTENSEQTEEIYRLIEEQLKNIVGTKVNIKRRNSGKGTIEIEYYSPQELDRILDLLHTVREEKV